jgi:molybdenum cofactor synthesis domain-containing protein
MARTGVSAVVIGTEVLTAKVTDQNGALLIRRLRDRGVPLHSMEFIHDDVEAIVDAVNRARQKARFVLTSGGIGPTHDDVTVRAVALALGRNVVRLPEMVELIRAHYRDAATPEAFRLADAPEGTRLLENAESWYPVLSCDDVFILPGVPQLFRLQLETVLSRLPGLPVHVRGLYLGVGESLIAAVLDRVALEMPDVAIGSYPQFGADTDYRVKVTLESTDLTRADAAFARLTAELPAGSILRAE